jgi:hypothetical protein
VDRDPEPGLPRLPDERRELAVGVGPGAVGARAGDVDADDPARRVADRLLDDDRVLPLGEGPVHHQEQAGAHLRVLEAGAVEPADRGHDDVVEVALAAPVALHRVEAELERRDPLRAVGAADRGVDGALDGERARLDQLRPLVDPVERGQVGDLARVGDGDELDELPVVLDRQRDSLLVRQRPQDLGRDRAAEVGVQLGEAFLLGHPPSLPGLLSHSRFAMKVLGLRWVGVGTDSYEEMVGLLRDALGLAVAFEENATAEFSLANDDRVQVFGPGHPYYELFGAGGGGPVPLFEVDDAQAARAELVAAGVEVIGEIERDASWEWLTFRGPDGNLYELASRL